MEVTMTVTVDKKVVIGLFGKANTGNDLLSVLEMIVSSFTESTSAVPTLEEIKF